MPNTKIEDIAKKLGQLSLLDVNGNFIANVKKSLNSNIKDSIDELNKRFQSKEKRVDKKIEIQLKLYNETKKNMKALLEKAEQIETYKEKCETFEKWHKDVYDKKKEFSLEKFKKLNTNHELFNSEYEKLNKFYDDVNKYKKEDFIKKFGDFKSIVIFLKELKKLFTQTKESMKNLTKHLSKIKKTKSKGIETLQELATDIDLSELDFESNESDINQLENLLTLLN